MENLDLVLDKIKRDKENLQEKFSVSEIGVFGSCVRGEDTADSDLDILVDTGGSLDFFDFLELEEHLSALTAKKVDLVQRRVLKPAIGRQILEEVVYL